MNKDLSKQQLEEAKRQLTVNLVSSVAVKEMSHATSKLYSLQQELEKAKDNVEETKEILDSLEDHEITPELVTIIDDNLEDAGIDVARTSPKELVAVVGGENLGYGLSPANYRLTRVAAMENFMSEFFRKTKIITKQIATLFAESYIKFTTNIKDLRDSVGYVETMLKSMDDVKSTETVNLGTRLFNTFKLEGEVKSNWVVDLKRLEGTIKALSHIYIMTNQNYKQTVDSYFGGFEKDDEISSDKRIKAIAKSINPVPFKACNLKITHKDGYIDSIPSDLIQLRSVKLPGDAFFVDTRAKSRTTVINSLEEAYEYVKEVLLREKVTFQDKSPLIDKSITVNALSVSTMKELVKCLHAVLGEWENAFESIEKQQLDEREFKGLRRSIVENAELPEAHKEFITESLDKLTLHTQMEMVQIRASLNSYLTLLVKGYIDLIYLSVESIDTSD